MNKQVFTPSNHEKRRAWVKLFSGINFMLTIIMTAIFGFSSITALAQSCNTPIPLDLSGVSNASPNVTNVPISGTVTFDGTLTIDNSTDTGIPNGLANGSLRLGFDQDDPTEFIEYTINFSEPVLLNLQQSGVNGFFDNQESWTLTTDGPSLIVNDPGISNPLINNGSGGFGPELQFVSGNGSSMVSFTPTANGGHVAPADSEWSIISDDYVSSLTIRYQASVLNQFFTSLNQRGPMSLFIQCVAPLEVTKTVSPTGDADLGDILTYTVEVTNGGSAGLLTGITVDDVLPSGVSYVADSTVATGPVVTGRTFNYADNFEGGVFSGTNNNSGTDNWANDAWIRDGANANTGDVQDLDPTDPDDTINSNLLQLDDNNAGAFRLVDLSAATSATISFSYDYDHSEMDNDAGLESFLVQFSNDDGASYTTLGTITIPANQQAIPGGGSDAFIFPASAFPAANDMRIRFITDSNDATNDEGDDWWIDNVVINADNFSSSSVTLDNVSGGVNSDLSSGVPDTVTTSGGDLITASDGPFALDAGETLTITYDVEVTVQTFSTQTNTVTADSNESDPDTATVDVSTTPVTLSSFSSVRSGSYVEFDWGTSSELFNVGFQLWGQDIDGQWSKLHNWLVRSGSGNAVEPQSYSKRVKIPNSLDQLVRVGISSVDSDGSEHYYGPFELGQSYGGLSQLEPIAWDHIRDEVDASMIAKGYVKDRVNGYRKVTSVALQASASPDTQTVVEFSVSKNGMYRITVQALLAAGIDWRDVRKGDLALLDHYGEAVVRYVWARGSGRGLNKTLGDKGEIYFYGQSPDETEGLYTDSSMYRLVLDRYRALKAQYQPKQNIHSGYSDYYMEHSVVENDALYVLTSAADDPWLSRVLLSYPNKPILYGVPIPVEADALWNQASTLTLGLGRSSHLTSVDADLDGQQDPEHIVEGLVVSTMGSSNDLLNLATETAVGSGKWDIEFSIPVNTPLAINDGHVLAGGGFSAGSGYAFSEVHVDSIGLAYARPYMAKANDNHLHFNAPNAGEQGYEVVIPDKGWPWVFASDGSNLVRMGLESQGKQTGSSGEKQRVVRFAALNQIGDTQVNYWVSGKAGYLSVNGLTKKLISSPDTLLAQSTGANLLIVSHPVFMGDTLTGYAAFKQSQGYSVAIIDYLDIVDSFGGGQPGPQGLTNYLLQVETLGRLDHVLLVGGSTYDHTDIQGTGAVTFIPGHYGQSSYSKFTVSDVPYITNSDNELFASIGRWPVRTGNDLQVIVNKSMAWSNRDKSDNIVLLIAEHTNEGEEIDFGQALDGLTSSIPGNWRQPRVYVDDILKANPNYTIPQALAVARSQVITELNNTPDLVLYNGHATTSQLSNKALFKSSNVGQITAKGAEMWLPMSCYVTFYESTHVNTLAHQLMFSGNAVNITGAMLLSNQSENIQIGEHILDHTLNGSQSIGEAVNNYKSTQNNPEFNINWTLLGDPTAIF